MARPILRTCVGCRKRQEQHALVRVSVDPAGEVIVHPRRPQGRGAYLCPSLACLARAWDRRAFPRAFRRKLPRLEAGALRARFEEELNRRGVIAE
jgi:predicted RNA-binding protein YlxR (DUF448 family)